MARDTRLASYDERLYGAVDLDENNQPFAPYHSTSSRTEYDDTFPHDPVPLFLSEPAEPEDGFEFETASNRAAISSRILKVSFLLLTAAGISFAILSVPNPLALFANAKASLIGASSSADQPAAPVPSRPQPAAAVQLASNTQPAQAVQPAAVVSASAATERVTRDDIAAALRAAHQDLAEARPPAQGTPAAPAPRAAGTTHGCRRTRKPDEAGQGPDRDRRHRAGAAVARTGGGGAGSRRRAAAGSDLRSRGAGHARTCEASHPIRRRLAAGTRRPRNSARRTRGCDWLKCRISFFESRGQQCDDWLGWRFSP